MRKLLPSVVIPILAVGLSLPTFALAQAADTKDPPVSGDSSTNKAPGKGETVAPATKAMDQASSPEKTGVPDSGSTTPNTVPDSRYRSDVKSQKKKDTRAEESLAVDAKPRTGVSGPKGARDVDPLKETPALLTPGGDRE